MCCTDAALVTKLTDAGSKLALRKVGAGAILVRCALRTCAVHANTALAIVVHPEATRAALTLSGCGAAARGVGLTATVTADADRGGSSAVHVHPVSALADASTSAPRRARALGPGRRIAFFTFASNAHVVCSAVCRRPAAVYADLPLGQVRAGAPWTGRTATFGASALEAESGRS